MGTDRPALRRWAATLALLGGLAASGSVGGQLAGLWRTPDGKEQAVTLSYHREANGEGRITVRLGPGGQMFAGQYLRLTGKRPEGRLRVLYSRWNVEGFDEFRDGPSGLSWERKSDTLESFRKRYTGAVLATLIGDRGGSMRCHFALEVVEDGLSGGATGQCQVTEGDVIEVLPARQTREDALPKSQSSESSERETPDAPR